MRAFTGEPLCREHVAAVRSFIASTRPPFGVEASAALVHADADSVPRKLGSYGSVAGARDFMGLAYADGPLADVAAAHWFERIVLYCTSLGLGTIWLAGFTRSSFLGQLDVGGARVRYACPVGYPGGGKPLVERLTTFDSARMHARKQPFGVLFLQPDFETPLTPEAAGAYARPLELARLAPSAKNQQQFRVVVDGSACHFFALPSRFGRTDLGIALSHFDVACGELDVPGRLDVVDAPTRAGFEYGASWVA